LLLIVDFAEIENRALCGLAAWQSPVFDHAKVAMALAVFATIGAAQKHASAAECQRLILKKRG
jgi:hypothetical protein